MPKVNSKRKQTVPAHSKAWLTKYYLDKDDSKRESGGRNERIPKCNQLEALDAANKKLYLYTGGERPSLSGEIYVVDIETKKCTDLSTQLRHLQPDFSLCALENTQATFKPLPSLSLPSFTFTKLNSVNYLILFGGEDVENPQSKPSSNLILIDVDHLRWWKEPFEGAIPPRNGATITAFDGKIFIFGGHGRAGNFSIGLPSYSVLEFSTEKGKWLTARAEVAYPEDVIGQLTFKHALPVYNNKQIFLIPIIGQDPVYPDAELRPDNMCFFDPNHFTFQVMRFSPKTSFPKTSILKDVDRHHGIPAFELEVLVDKPEPERYYSWIKHTFVQKTDSHVLQSDLWNLYKHTFSSLDLPTPLLSAQDAVGNIGEVFPGCQAQCVTTAPDFVPRYCIMGLERRKVALPIEYTYHAQHNSGSVTAQSILIVGRKCGANGREGIYGLWKLTLFPDNRIACLDVSEKLQTVGAGMRYAVVIDEQVFLVGDTDTIEISEDVEVRRLDSSL